VGDHFQGFHLTEELGRGAFGRVFLARQKALSDRPVALKLTTRGDAEALHLARLQHTHIMPVLSVHHVGPLQAVCMPFHGRTTLGHILRAFRDHAPPASGRSLVESLRECPPTVPTSGPADRGAGGRHQPGPTPARDMLARMRFTDAVVWIGARLADGLAHAHERGVLHRDLKPDNVLLADDGTPMLLDFNLAAVTAAGAGGPTGCGGTLLYMAPEHLAAFAGRAGAAIDARSDLYALGLILYELLAGRHPFPLPDGRPATDPAALVASRNHRPEPIRRSNRTVPAAVDVAVCQLLDPDPARRYQTARSLGEDLDRHLSHHALRHAPEPVRSRARKWFRRNPRAVPLLALVVALVGGGVLAAGAVAAAQTRQVEQAVTARGQFRDDLRAGQMLLAATTGDPLNRTAGADKLRAALARYHAADDPRWRERPGVSLLPPAEQASLRADVGEALLLLARVTARDDPAGAVRLNRQAEAEFPPDGAPAALWRLRADLVDRTGDAAAAAAADRRAAAPAAPSAQAAYLDGSDRAIAGRYADAIPPLEEACWLDPAHPAATFTLGFCYDAVGRDAEALECYRACIALRPDSPWPHLNRGLVYFRRGDDRRAMADLDAAVRLKADWADAVFTRGTLHQRAGRWAEAVKDYAAAEELGCRRARLFLLRGQCKQRLNDPSAGDDRAAGFAAPPADEHDHLARGVDLMAVQPERAVKEFDRALAVNPRSLPALQNKAHVLAEHLSDTAGAVAALDRAVELYPAFVPARGGRAVLLARLGKREAAQRDAAECLRRDTSPRTLYQLAGVYAQTARKHPDDLREAVRLLGAAFTAGFRDFATVDRDPDLDPIRTQPAFAAVVREFRPTPAPKPPG
jgi:serine/threonine protein kinase/tetratricopeptide (TPR) repeat protein